VCRLARGAVCVALVLTTLASVASHAAQGKQEAKARPAPSGPHVVRRGPLRIEVKLRGILEAARMAEVALAPEAWGELVVMKAVAQGTRVRQGEQVVWLDLRKIDEAIRQMEEGSALAELAIRQAEESVRLLARTTPLSLEAARRAKRAADEDLDRFLKIDRPLSEKSARFALKDADFRLLYAKEDLRQLEKMYKADDLTEETEEIILKRARHGVERAELSREKAIVAAEKTLELDLPRREKAARDAARRKTYDLDWAEASMPMQLEQKRLELDKARRDRTKAVDRLAKLKRDRQAMLVRAPADGIVYYGHCVRGHWPTAAAVAARLRKGGVLKPHEVFLTIVAPQPSRVRAVVPEKELHRLRAGLDARVVPTGYPDLKLAAKLDTLSLVPVKEGSFDAGLSLVEPKAAAALTPGMTCSVTVAAYARDDAIAVPAACVFTEGATRCVYVVGKAGKPTRRPVTVGRRTDGKLEILKGLDPGERILTRKPAAKP